MSKAVGFNGLEGIGYVSNFKVGATESGYKYADISLRDEKRNNFCRFKLWNRDSLKFDGNPITLEGLKNKFLNADGTSKHILVKVKSNISERTYTNKRGENVVDTTPNAYTIEPHYNPEEQGIIFNVTGIVDSISYSDSMVRAKIGVIKTDKDKIPNKLEFITVIARDEVAEQFEEQGVDKYSEIRVAGMLLNMEERDEYGPTGRSIKEARVEKLRFVHDEDSYEGLEEIYKPLKTGKPIKQIDEDTETTFGTDEVDLDF